MHTASHDSFGLHPEENLKTISLKYYWFAKGLKGFKWAALLRRVRSPMVALRWADTQPPDKRRRGPNTNP